MTIKRKLEAVAHKEGKWWEIHIHELDQVTQASRAKDIQDMATDLAAVVLNLDPDEVEVNVTLRAPDEVHQRWAQAREDIEKAQELSAKGAAESRAVVAELRRTPADPRADRVVILDLHGQRVEVRGVEVPTFDL